MQMRTVEVRVTPAHWKQAVEEIQTLPRDRWGHTIGWTCHCVMAVALRGLFKPSSLTGCGRGGVQLEANRPVPIGENRFFLTWGEQATELSRLFDERNKPGHFDPDYTFAPFVVTLEVPQEALA